ncbi:alpha/beta fold hydrolase [Alkalilacustris brevis]|uniref:alpha/beta fold hydrolase n=1 Tax=Alkalilacustris brevis TaxID=2026338 RepID=UPI000E0D00CB|nr:alpha/beta hydrolase [Alkalilacustris brevis]
MSHAGALPPAPLYIGPDQAPSGPAAFWLRTGDGLRLRAVLMARGARGTVILLPGRGEFIEKYAHVASKLADNGYGVLALDWRGQGLSQRLASDPRLGHVEDFAAYQLDLAALRVAADTLELAQPHLLLAHSMGGCIGLRALCSGAWPEVTAAAFSAPMWGLPLNGLTGLGARALGRVAHLAGGADRAVPGDPDAYDLRTIPFETNEFTTDRAMFDRMQALARAHPELCIAAPSLGWLAAALREMRALARLPSPEIPALVALGSREAIVDPEAIAARVSIWPGARLLRIEGGAHELMMESPARREEFLAAVCALFDRGIRR